MAYSTPGGNSSVIGNIDYNRDQIANSGSMRPESLADLIRQEPVYYQPGGAWTEGSEFEDWSWWNNPNREWEENPDNFGPISTFPGASPGGLTGIIGSESDTLRPQTAPVSPNAPPESGYNPGALNQPVRGGILGSGVELNLGGLIPIGATASSIASIIGGGRSGGGGGGVMGPQPSSPNQQQNQTIGLPVPIMGPQSNTPTTEENRELGLPIPIMGPQTNTPPTEENRELGLPVPIGGPNPNNPSGPTPVSDNPQTNFPIGLGNINTLINRQQEREPVDEASGDTISFSFNPAMATPITVQNPNRDRNLLQEGLTSAPAMRQIAESTLGSYGMLSGQPGRADIANFQGLIGSMRGYNPQLTEIANQQTIESQRALRDANIADVQRLRQQAMEAQRLANPELYSALGAYQGAAQGMLTSDLQRLQQGGQLNAQEIRSAQQAAREAGASRGREMDQSTVAAEVLNRDALMRAREAQSRANVQQSMQNVYGGIGAAQAATFNPFETLLGQQYGMQTSNVGLNQALFNQGTGFSSGGLSNQFVQSQINPYSPYAQDIYEGNFNAANSRAIAQAMANAAAQGANQQLIGNLGSTIIEGTLPTFFERIFGRNPGTNTGTPAGGTTPAPIR